MSVKRQTHLVSGAGLDGESLSIAYHFDDGRALVRYSEPSSRSINELIHWAPKTDVPSEDALVQKCEDAKKTPLDCLSVKQIHLLLTQEIALDFIVPKALDVLQHNHCIDANLNVGDLLKGVLDIPNDFWRKNPRLRWVAEDILNEFLGVGAMIETSRKSFSEFSEAKERS